MENFSNQTVEIDALPKYEEVAFNPISDKYLIKVNIQTLLFLVVALAGWGVLFYYEMAFLVRILILVAIILYFGFKFWNNFKLQDRYGYALREKDILYRRGFLISTTTVIPFNRIQHASVSRDILDKFLGISSVQVFTAGGSGSDISVPGLKPEIASGLKEALAKKLASDGNKTL